MIREIAKFKFLWKFSFYRVSTLNIVFILVSVSQKGEGLDRVLE